MKQIKVHFPILIVTLALACLFFSCKHQSQVVPSSDSYNRTIDKAISYNDKQRYDSAYYYFNKAKSLCGKNEKDKIVFPLIYMAGIEQIECDYSASEATVTEALGLVTDQRYLPSLYNLLGIAFQEQYDYRNALKYYTKCMSVTSDPKAKNVVRNNIGYTYLEAKRLPEAIAVLQRLSKQNSLLSDPKIYAKVLDNLGYAYFKNNDTKAFNFLNRAMTLRDSLKDNYELIASSMHMSEYYLHSNLVLAHNYAQNAFDEATKVNSPDDKVEALKYLIAASTPSQAQKYALQQIQLSDSIAKKRQMAKNQFAKIKYDSRVAMEQGQRYKKEKQFYLFLCIGIGLISIMIYFVIRWRNNKKIQEESYVTETRIAKKLHDELANDMFNVMTYAETQNLEDSSIKETLVDNLEDIYLRTRNISKENSEIETNSHYEVVLKELLSNYSSPQVNVIVNRINAIDWNQIKKESKIVVYRVLQELMVNMKKHSQCSLAIVSFENNKNTIEISYSDNGIGCAISSDSKKGLQNAENRILAIKGNITFETELNKGFKVKMIIPK